MAINGEDPMAKWQTLLEESGLDWTGAYSPAQPNLPSPTYPGGVDPYSGIVLGQTGLGAAGQPLIPV